MKQEKTRFFSINKESDRVIASFNDLNRLTVLNAKVIREELMAFVTKRDCLLEIDLSNIKFIDSSIFDILNLLSRMGRSYNSRVILSNVSKELLDLIDLVKRHSVFDIKQVSTSLRTRFVA